MSYCHLQAVGINFANGFGSQPGNLIRTNINTAPCLGICVACDADVTITGTYSNALTESSTWISSSGQTTILSTASVKLDADATAGYVLLAPASNADAFTAAPSTNSAMFVAQAYNGCTNGSPSRPNQESSEWLHHSETASGLRLFPNPAGNRISLWSPTYSGKPCSLSILSMDGRTWLQTAARPFDEQQELDISSLPAGIYLLKLQQENGTQALRFQKL